jgi:hypothetical protein
MAATQVIVTQVIGTQERPLMRSHAGSVGTIKEDKLSLPFKGRAGVGMGVGY